jgi:peptidoglycan/LPS O-acetylase OafA/YrhL
MFSAWAEHGHSAVPGFFILSGWVLAHNYRESFRNREVTVLRFLGLRLARIYPVHLAMIAALGILVIGASLSGRPLGDSFGIPGLVAHLLLVQAWLPGVAMTWNYPAWSISSEWFAYLVFPFLARSDLLFSTRPMAWATTIAATIATVWVVVSWNPLPLFELVLVVPCFLTGMGIQALLARRGEFGRAAAVGATFLLGALAASCYVPDFLLREFLLASIPAAMVFLLAGRGFASAGVVWEARPVRLLGETSYSLYMVHSVVEKILSQLVPPERFAESGLFLRLSLVGAWVVATAVATWACYAFVERPARRYMRRRLG